MKTPLSSFGSTRKDPCKVFNPAYYACVITTYNCVIIHIQQLSKETYQSPNINYTTYFTPNHQFKIKSHCNHFQIS